MLRRDFLSLALLSPLASAAFTGCAEEPTPASRHLHLGPYLCDPRPDAMGFFVASKTLEPLFVDVADATSTIVVSLALSLDAQGLGRADASGLPPDSGFTYVLRTANEELVRGRFRTPPSDRASFVRLAVTADIHPDQKPYRAFDAIHAYDPHLLLCIGDQIYADLGSATPASTLEEYRAAYRETWRDASLARCWRDVPTALIWDDHEIWNDYDGLDPDRFAIARQAYDEYQASRDPVLGSLEGRWFRVSLGPVDAFVLDTRSHRSPSYAYDDSNKTMLGPAQLAALQDFLLTSDAPVKLVVSPTPFHAFADTGADSWHGGYRTERDALFAFLAAESVGNVILLSGDQHWPAVVRHDLGGGKSVHELQCTPVAAFARAPSTSGDPSLLYVGDGSPGFGRLDVDARTATPTVRFAWVDASGRERYVLPSVPLA